MAYNRLMSSACCLRRLWRDPLETVDSFFHSLLGSVPVRRAFASSQIKVMDASTEFRMGQSPLSSCSRNQFPPQ